MHERFDKWLSRERQSPSAEVEIDRDSIWTNPLFKDRIPFDLEKVLSRFLVNKTPDGVKPLHFGIDYIHGREGLICKIGIADNLGHQYSEASLKGNGYVVSHWMPYPWPGSRLGRIQRRNDGRMPQLTMGLVRKEAAYMEAKQLVELAQAPNPIRVPQVLAIADLMTIAQPDGSQITVTRARQEGIIAEDAGSTPVVVLRCFRNGQRVAHEGLIDDKLGLAVREFSNKSGGRTAPALEYLDWMISQAAINLSRIHFLGLYHGALKGGHNLTLANEVVDFRLPGKSLRVMRPIDMRGMLHTLDLLKERMCQVYRFTAKQLDRYSVDNLAFLFVREYQKEATRLDKRR